MTHVLEALAELMNEVSEREILPRFQRSIRASCRPPLSPR